MKSEHLDILFFLASLWAFLGGAIAVESRVTMGFVLGSIFAYIIIDSIVSARHFISPLRGFILASIFFLGTNIKGAGVDYESALLIGSGYSLVSFVIASMNKLRKKKEEASQSLSIRPIWINIIGISYILGAILTFNKPPYVMYLLWIPLGIGIIKGKFWARVAAILSFPCWVLAATLLPSPERIMGIGGVFITPFQQITAFLLSPKFLPEFYITYSPKFLPVQVFYIVYLLHLYCLVEPKTGDFFRRTKIELKERKAWEVKKKREIKLKEGKKAGLKERRIDFLGIWKRFSQRFKIPTGEFEEVLDIRNDKVVGLKERWEELSRKYPTDLRLVHCIAIHYYWMIETDGGNSQDEFIANWVMLLSADEFWNEWVAERQGFYFNKHIDPREVDGFKQELWGMVERVISEEHKEAFLLEKKTVEVLKRLSKWGIRQGLPELTLICGPLKLRHLKKLEELKRLAILGAQKYFTNDPGFKELKNCLSDFALASLLLEKNKELEEVFIKLDMLSYERTAIPEDFKESFVNKVIQIAANKEIEEAISILKRAFQKVEDEGLREALCDKYMASANKSAMIGDWIQAANYAEKALDTYPSNEDVKRKLLISYNRACFQYLEKGKTQQAKNIISKIEKLAGEDLKHNKDLCQSLINMCISIADQLLDQNKPSEARSMVDEVKKYGFSGDELKQLCQVIELFVKFGGKSVLETLSKAREKAKENKFTDAIDRYREAMNEAKKKANNDGMVEIEHELALCLNARGVKKAEKAIPADSLYRERFFQLSPIEKERICEQLKSALIDLQEANSLNPENEVISNNLKVVHNTWQIICTMTFPDIRYGQTFDVDDLIRLMRKYRLL